MTVTVRGVEPHDLDVIETIENDADRLLINRLQPASWTAAPTGAARTAEPGLLLVVEHDGAVVGFVQVLEVDGLCHLEQVSVSPEHGGRGYGRLLVEAAKRHAHERGYRRMSLRTYAEVPFNAPFYATAGFTEQEPSTRFHESLVAEETSSGLDRHGRRVLMVAELG